MERKQRRTFSEEFKTEAVRMASNRKVTEVARNLGISLSALNRWISQSKSVVVEEEQDLAKKCKLQEAEINRLKIERDILKKATAYFAKDVV